MRQDTARRKRRYFERSCRNAPKVTWRRAGLHLTSHRRCQPATNCFAPVAEGEKERRRRLSAAARQRRRARRNQGGESKDATRQEDEFKVKRAKPSFNKAKSSSNVAKSIIESKKKKTQIEWIHHRRRSALCSSAHLCSIRPCSSCRGEWMASGGAEQMHAPSSPCCCCSAVRERVRGGHRRR